jgi:hypothetical protein
MRRMRLRATGVEHFARQSWNKLCGPPPRRIDHFSPAVVLSKLRHLRTVFRDKHHPWRLRQDKYQPCRILNKHFPCRMLNKHLSWWMLQDKHHPWCMCMLQNKYRRRPKVNFLRRTIHSFLVLCGGRCEIAPEERVFGIVFRWS